MTTDVELTSRAGPKPASPTFRNLKIFLKKLLQTNTSYTLKERFSAVCYMYVEK
jgi:hypothetical protein